MPGFHAFSIKSYCRGVIKEKGNRNEKRREEVLYMQEQPESIPERMHELDEEVQPVPSAEIGPEMKAGTEMVEEDMAEEMAQEMGAPQSEARQAEARRTYVEEQQVRAGQLLNTVQNLLRESNVRRIRIKNKAGRVVLDIPVWIAAVAGATAVIAAPIITAIGVLGGLLANVRIEVERTVEEETKTKTTT